MVAEYVPTLRAALPSPPQPLPWYPAQLAWQFDVSRAELRGKGAAADAPPPAGAATLAAFHAWLLDGTETVDAILAAQQALARQIELSGLIQSGAAVSTTGGF